MKWALLTQGLDLFTFPFAVAIWGIGGEWNPVMAGIYAGSGLLGVFLAKLFGTFIIIRLSRYLTSWRRNVMIGALGVVGALGALTNTVAILVS